MPWLGWLYLYSAQTTTLHGGLLHKREEFLELMVGPLLSKLWIWNGMKSLDLQEIQLSSWCVISSPLQKARIGYMDGTNSFPGRSVELLESMNEWWGQEVIPSAGLPMDEDIQHHSPRLHRLYWFQRDFPVSQLCCNEFPTHTQTMTPCSDQNFGWILFVFPKIIKGKMSKAEKVNFSDKENLKIKTRHFLGLNLIFSFLIFKPRSMGYLFAI